MDQTQSEIKYFLNSVKLIDPKALLSSDLQLNHWQLVRIKVGKIISVFLLSCYILRRLKKCFTIIILILRRSKRWMAVHWKYSRTLSAMQLHRPNLITITMLSEKKMAPKATIRRTWSHFSNTDCNEKLHSDKVNHSPMPKCRNFRLWKGL